MKNILIDPTMFNIKDRDEIQKNCDFFQKIIWLCDSKSISICIYKGLIDKILNRQIQPFPININEVEDPELKQKLLILNNSFVQTINSSFIGIDIDSCEGDQELITNRQELENDTDYYELFCMMIRPCYKEVDNIENVVLVGEKSDGVNCGENVEISCKCLIKQFSRIYLWVSPSYLENKKEKAFFALKEVVQNSNKLFVEMPITVRGDHHNKIQNKEINQYSDLTAKNKRVLSLLRYFGLAKIIFERFKPDTSQLIGTIIIDNVRDGAGSEIVSGWIYCQTGFKCYVEMYFPIGIGYNLSTYTEECLSYDIVEKLKTRLAL
ncbi:MAG: hypothetical protein NC300_07655 [Bacteroidales bacterium]|nr:hypothetical protein [Clostridium sp.]MCM1204004.1 hypothetical protein [Bacteroidales bacterium]